MTNLIGSLSYSIDSKPAETGAAAVVRSIESIKAAAQRSSTETVASMNAVAESFKKLSDIKGPSNQLAQQMGAFAAAAQQMGKISAPAASVVTNLNAFFEALSELKVPGSPALARLATLGPVLASLANAKGPSAASTRQITDFFTALNSVKAPGKAVVDSVNSLSQALSSPMKVPSSAQTKNLAEFFSTVSQIESPKNINDLADALTKLGAAGAAANAGLSGLKTSVAGAVSAAGGATKATRKAASEASDAHNVAWPTVAREGMVILREWGRGDFTRMAGSISILGQAFGMLTNPFVALTVASIAAMAAVVAAGLKFDTTFKKMDMSMKAAGNSTGMTMTSMREFAEEVGKTSHMSTYAAMEIERAFGPARLGETAFKAAVGSIKKYAEIMEMEMPDAAKSMARILQGDLGQAMTTLDSQIDFLNGDLKQQILDLNASGKAADAAALMMTKFGKAVEEAGKAGKNKVGSFTDKVGAWLGNVNMAAGQFVFGEHSLDTGQKIAKTEADLALYTEKLHNLGDAQSDMARNSRKFYTEQIDFLVRLNMELRENLRLEDERNKEGAKNQADKKAAVVTAANAGKYAPWVLGGHAAGLSVKDLVANQNNPQLQPIEREAAKAAIPFAERAEVIQKRSPFERAAIDRKIAVAGVGSDTEYEAALKRQRAQIEQTSDADPKTIQYLMESANVVSREQAMTSSLIAEGAAEAQTESLLKMMGAYKGNIDMVEKFRIAMAAEDLQRASNITSTQAHDQALAEYTKSVADSIVKDEHQIRQDEAGAKSQYDILMAMGMTRNARNEAIRQAEDEITWGEKRRQAEATGNQDIINAQKDHEVRQRRVNDIRAMNVAIQNQVDDLERLKKASAEAESAWTDSRTDATPSAIAGGKAYSSQMAVFEQNSKHLDKNSELYAKSLEVSTKLAEQARHEAASTELLARKRSVLESIRGPQGQYNEEMAITTELYKSGAISLNDYTYKVASLQAQTKAASHDLMDGFERGFYKFKAESADFASLSERLVTDAFKGMEDAMVEFVKTGKLDFRSLADSMIADIARIQIRMMMNNIFGMGSTGGLMGGNNGTGGANGTAGAAGAGGLGLLGSLMGGDNGLMGWLGGGISDLWNYGEWNHQESVNSVIDELLGGLDTSMADSAFSGMDWSMAFAKGNAFDSGLVHTFAKGSSFTNGVYRTPTPFMFANGDRFANGIMGEAGAEAVVPLKRGSDGSLGVQMVGGTGGAGSDGGTVVQIIDQRGAGAPPAQTSDGGRGPDGRRILRVLIQDEQKRGMNSGEMDPLMQQNFGVNRVGINR